MNFGSTIHLNKKVIFIILLVISLLWVYKKRNTNNVPRGSLNLHKLLEISIKAAQNGGIEIVSGKDDLKIKSKGLTKEGMQDSVTSADFLSHCAMTSTIQHYFPSVKVVSEEITECSSKQVIDFSNIVDSEINQLDDDFVNEEDVTVWIDPLDATHEYTEKLYQYVTTMVCVAVNGKPIIGIIHKPFSKETFWAWINKAKSKNLVHKKSEDVPKIIISRSHSGKIKDVLSKEMKIITAAGAGYKALEVATGNVDAYLHITIIKKWDICAGNAILKSLGGKMTTGKNKEIDYSNAADTINKDGLVATIDNHELYLSKIA